MRFKMMPLLLQGTFLLYGKVAPQLTILGVELPIDKLAGARAAKSLTVYWNAGRT